METPKKILEKSPFSGIAVPIAIVLVGALIIFGITKMLSSGKNHRDLVEELHSKTFGNRWVAAFELSKYIAGEKIPEEDIPWVIKNLSQVYTTSVDDRTRNFTVLALGGMRNSLSAKTLSKAVLDKNSEVKYHATVGLGNLPQGSQIDWSGVYENLKQDQDMGLVQVSLLALAQHQVPEAQSYLRTYSENKNSLLSYAASTGLIYYKDPSILDNLKKILSLSDQNPPENLNGAQVEALKLNVLNAIEKMKWTDTKEMIESIALNDANNKISTKARQVLILLKK